MSTFACGGLSSKVFLGYAGGWQHMWSCWSSWTRGAGWHRPDVFQMGVRGGQRRALQALQSAGVSPLTSVCSGAGFNSVLSGQPLLSSWESPHGAVSSSHAGSVLSVVIGPGLIFSRIVWKLQCVGFRHLVLFISNNPVVYYSFFQV